MIQWMEGELGREDLALVVVTHDRAFMEATCVGFCCRGERVLGGRGLGRRGGCEGLGSGRSTTPWALRGVCGVLLPSTSAARC